MPAYGRGGDESERWCEARAIGTEAAVLQLTGHAPGERFSSRFEEVLERAQEAARSCPADMGGPGNLDLIYHLAAHARARRVVETGVAYGWSSLALLLSLSDRQDSRLISTDMPYLQRGTDDFVGVVVPAELRSRWSLLRYPDRDGLPKALRMLPELDMCHYDSDKSYDGRMWAYAKLWEALRTGGIFVSDDVADDVAFRDFCAALGREPVIVAGGEFAAGGEAETKYAGVLVK